MQSKIPTAKHKFEGHEQMIDSFVFLHDNVHVVSGSLDGTMRKWNCDTGHLVGKPWKGEGEIILALALSPDGKTIACGRGNGSVQRWDTDGKMKSIWSRHSKRVRSLSWSPSGGHIASGSNDGTILIREAESGKVDVGPIKTSQDNVWSLAYSPLGDKIASGGDKTICIWDSNTGKLLVGPIEDLRVYVSLVVWSLDGSNLYSASDHFARVFDSVSGTLLHRFEHDEPLYSVALSPKHNVLACVGAGGVAQLWDTESHKPLGQPFPQVDGKRLRCVSFSPDGQYLAYGGDDNKISLWMVQDIAPQLTVRAPMSENDFQAGPSQRKQKNPKDLLNMEIRGHRRRQANQHIDKLHPRVVPSAFQLRTHVDDPPSAPSRLHGIKNFFSRVQLSSDTKGKRKEHRAEIEAQDVALGQATYGDYVAGEEDGIRPYALLFCLSWFQKKEKKPDPPSQVYDVDLMKAEQKEDPLDIPVPIRARSTRQDDIELTPMVSQSQPEAGPSRLAENKEYPEAQSV